MKKETTVRICWDNSNIFIPAQSIAARRDGPYADRRLRIHFENLFRLAHAGRQVDSGVFVGSRSAVPPAILQRLVLPRLSVEFYERGLASRKEQGVDQCLQVQMLRTATDVATPGVAVLLTGDGAGYAEGVGYHADLERLFRLGWGIEVLAWEEATSLALRRWAESVGVFVSLDRYFQSVTFIKGGRIATPMSLVHRARALPRLRMPVV
jgi:hypothetical protein